MLIEHFDDERIAGVLLRRGDGDAFIAVNADHGAVRQRFTLAHELGHHQMRHQPRLELASDLFGNTARNDQEVEANYFAAEFLAPRVAVRSWLEEQDLLASAEDPGTVVRLALQFGVAFTTACIRLERADVISTRAKGRLMSELGQVGPGLARAHSTHRLMDSIERLWRAKEYPRVPRQTIAYAEQARDAGLLDEAEYAAIVTSPPDLDLDDWLT